MKALMKTFIMVIVAASAVPVWAVCNDFIEKQKPDSIYTDNNDGTITDHETGLMWRKCSLGLSGSDCSTGTATSYTWGEALQAAQSANAGDGSLGYDDWRLPSINELRSLSEHACDPAINRNYFPEPLVWETGTLKTWYWSSTPSAPDHNTAWVLSSKATAVSTEKDESDTSNSRVRLVRGGQ